MKIYNIAGKEKSARWVLDGSAFAELVAGREIMGITPDGGEVHITLSDIGWDYMVKAIEDARRELWG